MNTTSFLEDPSAERVFAKLDYSLREGAHIQDNDEQETAFSFIAANEESLGAYYLKFYKLHLEYSGEGKGKYYYLEFNDGERGPVDERHRHFLKSEHVIIGLLLYKMLEVDLQVELHSISKFQSLLRLEYEHLRPQLNYLFGGARPGAAGNNSQATDDRIDETIRNAAKEFEKLGWLLFTDADNFEPQPSFHRLAKLYADSINGLEDLIKSQPQP